MSGLFLCQVEVAKISETKTILNLARSYGNKVQVTLTQSKSETQITSVFTLHLVIC